MIRPPVAKRRNHRHTHHGITLEDAYYWLRDPAYPDVKDPEIIEYLTAENAYFDARMEAHQPLVTQLFEEIKGRQPAEDASVPHRLNIIPVFPGLQFFVLNLKYIVL